MRTARRVRAGARRCSARTSGRRPPAAPPAAALRGRPGKVRGARWSLRARSAASPVSNEARWRKRSGYSSSSPAATSASPECRATSGGEPAAAASAATIPNASGKIDGTTVASASGSRCTRCRCSSGPVKSVAGGAAASSTAAIRPEADDDQTRIDVLHRLEQHLHALLLDQLPEIDDERAGLWRGRRRAGRALPSSGRRSSPPFGGSVARLGQQVCERNVSVPQPNLSTSTPGGTSMTRPTSSDDISSTSRMCCEPTNVDFRVGERGSRPLAELGTPAHRVLELGAVRLDAETRTTRRADRAAHQHVVGEYQVGRQELAKRRRVRVDIRTPLGLGEVLQELRIEPLVVVHDERGQQAARQIDRDRPRAAEVVLLGRPLLRDDDDVVPGAAPFTRERSRVDIRPGPSEQVPVPEQDPHRGRRYSRTVPGTCHRT